MKLSTLGFTAATVASLAPCVLGHAYIVEPAAVWLKGYPDNGYSAEIPTAIWGTPDWSKLGYGPEGNLNYLKANFPSDEYPSLKELFMKKQKVLTQYNGTAECGYTIKDESKRAVLPSTITYSGFTHPGPCEVWCDDNKLLYELDCAKKYPDIPAKVPIDTAKCAGADRLTVYWMGAFTDPWQVYIDCVYLKGSTGGGSASAPAPATTTKAPAAATTAPVPTTAAPAADDADYADETEAPKPAPAPATSAPKGNCKRTRRN